MTDQEQFLNKASHVVIYGLSRSGQGYAYAVLKAIQNHPVHPKVTAVHPEAESLEGVDVVRSATAIDPPPDRAVIVLPEEKTLAAITDAGRAGIRDLWLAMRANAPANREYAETKLMSVVEGCPILFVPNPAFPCSIHRFFARLVGKV